MFISYHIKSGMSYIWKKKTDNGNEIWKKLKITYAEIIQYEFLPLIT